MVTPTKKPARPPVAMTPHGLPLKGSAGPRVLNDLGLTDAELAAFLPPDAPRSVRSVLWCQFEGPASLDAIADHFAGRYAVTRAMERRYPPDGPADGVEIAVVALTPKGRYARYCFYGMRGDVYVEDGSWQLEFTIRGSGADWGSNRAIFERFKAVELAGLGARGVTDRTQ